MSLHESEVIEKVFCARYYKDRRGDGGFAGKAFMCLPCLGDSPDTTVDNVVITFDIKSIRAHTTCVHEHMKVYQQSSERQKKRKQQQSQSAVASEVNTAKRSPRRLITNENNLHCDVTKYITVETWAERNREIVSKKLQQQHSSSSSSKKLRTAGKTVESDGCSFSSDVCVDENWPCVKSADDQELQIANEEESSCDLMSLSPSSASFSPQSPNQLWCGSDSSRYSDECLFLSEVCVDDESWPCVESADQELRFELQIANEEDVFGDLMSPPRTSYIFLDELELDSSSDESIDCYKAALMRQKLQKPVIQYIPCINIPPRIRHFDSDEVEMLYFKKCCLLNCTPSSIN